MLLTNATILWNKAIGHSFFIIGISVEKGFENARPGQFVMIGTSGQQQAPLLRRPFSIHGLIRKEGRVVGFELLYKVVGEGTRLLSQFCRGNTTDVLGPLGNTFKVPKDPGRLNLVAGGVGVPPIRFLTLDLVSRGMYPDLITVFLGARTADELLCVDDFKTAGVHLVLVTDDGSCGKKMLVTQALAEHMETAPADRIYACGPHGMLRAVGRIARDCTTPCRMSVEANMACGMGACLGCAIETRDNHNRYKHVCIDGPVFDADQLFF